MSKRMIGPFELESQLGVGGMGVVYLATYTKTGQKCALKVLSPALTAQKPLIARFEREMSILKKLRHKNIVRYFGGGKKGSQHFYAMEYIDGGSLADVLVQKGKLSWELTIEVSLQIAKGLEHAHQHGIIHRDLKPANVFVSKAGKIKLGDFGIARDTDATALTAAGKTVGSYAYMAPEQITGKKPVSRRTDLYALGCVMFELLSGRPPFTGQTAPELLMAHLNDEPERPSLHAVDCPVWLENIVLRLLEKDAEDRYYDALAVQQALSDVGEQVASQQSVARQTAVGGATVIGGKVDAGELRKIVGKKKRKKKKHQPFYEQIWFLALALVFIIGGVAWAVWPASEEKLFTRAQMLMESGTALDQQEARDRYLEPLVERFPEGEHAEQARAWLAEIEANVVERQVETRMKTGQDPKSEGERRYVEARRLEKDFGDRITALERYRAIVDLFKDQEGEQNFVSLARRRIVDINASGETEGEDRIALVNTRLREADELMKSGKMLGAQKIWRGVVNLYSSNKELERQVEYARARLDGKDVDDLDLSNQPEAKDSG